MLRPGVPRESGYYKECFQAARGVLSNLRPSVPIAVWYKIYLQPCRIMDERQLGWSAMGTLCGDYRLNSMTAGDSGRTPNTAVRGLVELTTRPVDGHQLEINVEFARSVVSDIVSSGSSAITDTATVRRTPLTRHTAGSEAATGQGEPETKVSEDPPRGAYWDTKRHDAFMRSLRLVRETAGLKQKLFARAMGTTQSGVSELESGRSDPRLTTLQRYARASGRRFDFAMVDDSLPVFDDAMAEQLGELLEKRTLSPLLTTIATHAPADRTLDKLSEEIGFPSRIVGPILNSLVGRGWVKIDDPHSEQLIYSLGNNAAYVIGLSIERDEIVGVLIDLHSNIVGKPKTEPLGSTLRADVIRTATKLSVDLYDARDGREILGVGVCIAGVVDPYGNVEFAPDLQTDEDPWSGVPLEAEIEAAIQERVRWKLRVAVDNDANSLAMREYLQHRPHSVSAILFSGAGIGAGFVSKGHLSHGAHSAAGEIGHIIVDPDGVPCRAGFRHNGCLETVASAQAILQGLGLKHSSSDDLMRSLAVANERMRHEIVGLRTDLAFLRLPAATITDILRSLASAAGKIDAERYPTVRAFAHAGEVFGKVLATVVTLLDPGKVVLFAHNELSDTRYCSASVFQEGVERGVRSAGNMLEPSPVREWAPIEKDTNAVAAGAAAMRHFFYDPSHWQPSVLRPRTPTGAIQHDIEQSVESEPAQLVQDAERPSTPLPEAVAAW